MLLGYNTNGFAHHHLDDVVAILGELGYRSIAITLDCHHLDPFAPRLEARVAELAARLREHNLLPVVETGARFLLDAKRKHKPTLLSAGSTERKVRIDFLLRAIDICAGLNAPVLSLWSGSADENEDTERLDERLCAGLMTVCERAAHCQIAVGFEPEPGMYIENMTDFRRLDRTLGHGQLALTLDVGHAHITEADGAAAAVHEWRARIVNVHLEGMNRTAHEHLLPWEGDMDVAAVVQALNQVDYRGPATLELSRHSHNAVLFATQAKQFFTDLHG